MDRFTDNLIPEIRSFMAHIKKDMEEYAQEEVSAHAESFMLQRSQNQQRIREIKDEMDQLDGQLSQIQAYYRGYIENADMSVQLASYPEQPVNMLVYRNELSNPNRTAAANVIVRAAKANMLYIRSRKKQLTDERNRLENDSRSGQRENQNELLEQYRRTYSDRMRPVVTSRISGLVFASYIQDSAAVIREYRKADWESRRYIEPEEELGYIYCGYADRSLGMPEEYYDMISDCGNYAGKGRLSVPVHLPLAEPFRLLVNYHVSNARETQEGIRTLLGNLLCSVKPKSMHTYYFDLEKMNASSLESLSRLCGGESAFIEDVPTDEDSVLARMTAIRRRCDSIAEKMIGYSSLESYNRAHPEEEIPRQLIVIYGCPERMSSRLLDPFMKLYYMSQDVGMSIIVIHSENGEISSRDAKMFYQNMQDDALVIYTDYGRMYLKDGEDRAPFHWFTGLNLLSEEFLADAGRAYAAEEKEKVKTDPTDNEIVHVRGNKGLDLPFGVDENGNVMRWQVTDTLNEINHSAYVSGSAGSGKSTLLHTLIYGILRTCHPEDVELWLADFKMTEFRRYAQNRPPHVKHIILENSEEVVLDLVDRLYEALDRRIKIFDQHGIKDILTMPEKYRWAHIPLIVVIIDEFATMSQILRNTTAPSDISYPQKLENLLSKGRAYGFRFIFSDQSYEAGISGLTEKSRAQIAFRFGLANTSLAELRSTLNIPSEYMTDDISHWISSIPPHVALTVQRQAKPGRLETELTAHRVSVTYIRDEMYEDLVRKLNEMYTASGSLPGKDDAKYLDKGGILVDGKQQLTWTDVQNEIEAFDAEKNYDRETHRFYLGKPCRIRKQMPVELNDALGENLLLFLSSSELTASVCDSAVRSARNRKIGGNTKVTIFASEDDRTYRTYRNLWKDVQRFDRIEDVCACVAELKDRIDRKEYCSELIVCFGLYELFNEWSGFPSVRKTSSGTPKTAAPSAFVEAAPVQKQEDDIFTKLLAAGAEYKDDGKEAEGPDFSAIDAFFAGEPLEKAQKPEVSAAGEDMLYNAWEDMKEVLTYGPRYGMHFILPFTDYAEFRELRAGSRVYRGVLYNRLVKEELSDLMGYGRYAALPEGAVRYVSKRDAFSLRPYRETEEEEETEELFIA